MAKKKVTLVVDVALWQFAQDKLRALSGPGLEPNYSQLVSTLVLAWIRDNSTVEEFEMLRAALQGSPE